MYGYTGVWAYGHMTSKFPRMDRLPNCVSYGATLVPLHAFLELCHKFSCEITKLPLQHSVDTSVSTWLTLDQNSTNMWLALNWHMDRYVSQHSVDMLTDSSLLITTWFKLIWESTGLLRGGCRFKSWLDQQSGSLNNWEETAAFYVMTSANG